MTKTGAAPQIPLDGLASLSYNTANNRINTAGFEYEPAGNQTRAVINDSGTQQQYRYDCAGRLAQVLDASGTALATYSYGVGNRRLMSVEGGVTTYYAWEGGQIIAEYEASGTNALVWKMSYVYMGGRLLATEQAEGIRYHHPDRLGTRLVTDASDGAVISDQLTMPFGTQVPYGSTLGGDNSWQHPGRSNLSKKRFTSYDRSDAAGLDYAVNRFYSSQQGRFAQVDPIGMSATNLDDPQSLNLYSYVGNDPINFVDPSGLDELPALGIFYFPTGFLNRQENRLGLFGSGGDNTSIEIVQDPPNPDNGGGQNDQPKMTPGQKRHCDRLEKIINDILDGYYSGQTWVKGLFERIEQQAGATAGPPSHGPGSEWWEKHRKQINNRRETLKWNLKKWNDSNCGPPPPRAKEALEKSKDGVLRDEWDRRQKQPQQNRGPDNVPVPIPIPPRIPWWKDILQPRMPIIILTPVWCAINPQACRPPEKG